VIDKKINGKTIGFRTNRKGFPESAWDVWYALTEYDNIYNNILDKSVYTIDREFRTIFSNKTSEFRPIVPYKTTIEENALITMKTEDCLRYMVTYAHSNEYYYLATPEVAKKYLVINKSYQSDGTFISPSYSDKKINYLMTLIRDVHRSAEYTGRSSCGSGWRFSYSNKDELCYTGNRHKSNGFYVFEDTTRGIIYMKCMSSDCKGIHILEQTKKQQTITKKIF
jgi:hypothetical protein